MIINNPTTVTGQTVFLSGSALEGFNTCSGQSDGYATTVTLAATGDNTFIIPASGGLNTGVWVHHISVGSQFQHQRTPVLHTTDSNQYATVRWTYHPTVIQVNKAGDALGACSGGVCTFRQALSLANGLLLSTPAILVQLMLSPGVMTQSGPLDLGGPGISTILTVDGTDALGNPWIVGDALAAAQGMQSTFSRAVDLKNTTKLRVRGNNVNLRGFAILNTTTGGVPSNNLLESTGTNTRIEAVRLDGGASGACGSCVDSDRNLMHLSAGLAQVANVEGRAAFSNGARVGPGVGATEIRDSWFHHNYGSGMRADGLVLTRNLIELTGRRLSDNAVMTNNGVGVRGEAASQIDSASNLIRNHTSYGVSAQLTTFGLDFLDDAVCGNGNVGMSLEKTSGSTDVTGTGLLTAYNNNYGVDFFGAYISNQIEFSNDSAFTANSLCGFHNQSSVTAFAENNQWRGATTSCEESSDKCTGGPIDCNPIENFVDAQIMLDMTQPTFPRNAFVKGQTIRVQGTGFNAIHGNPLASSNPGCALGSADVSSQNCCRKKDRANVCGGGTPPGPPSDGSNCVATLDVLGQWKSMAVTSVTPTTIVTEVPDPGLLCVGEGYTQLTRVVKQGSTDQIFDEEVYCRNLPL